MKNNIYKIPKGKKLVKVDDKTWLVVNKSRPVREVRRNFFEAIDFHDGNRKKHMKRLT